MVDLNIRDMEKDDVAACLALHKQAFGEEEGPIVSALVAELLDDPTANPRISLVAVQNQGVVGHACFSILSLDTHPELQLAILAPLAVQPNAQRSGIGKNLIKAGLASLEKSGCEAVFVYGDPAYYGQHGFSPISTDKIQTPQPLQFPEGWQVSASKI